MSKKLTSQLQIDYNVVLESIDKNTGKIIKRTEIHNIVVNDGLNLVRNWMAGDSINNPKAIALGTDATVPVAGDTGLIAEVERELSTISKPAVYQVQYAKVFSVGSGVSYSIKEAGLFDSVSVSGSTMFSRVSANNTLDADTDLSVTITYTISRV